MTRDESSQRRARIALQAWIALGGVAALSWELLWQIESSLALGVSALGTAITLATTMAGMTVGSYVCGRMLRGRAVVAPERLYGRLEAVIGLSGLAMPAGFVALEMLDARIWRLSPTLAPLLHGAGIALLLGPPTLAMGATVPVFERLARSYRTSLSRLYGINVAGAAVGVILLAFVLLPALGVRYTAGLVAALNLLVFAAMHLLRGGEAVPGGMPGAGPGHSRSVAPGAAVLIVFCTGFVTFGLEVAWFRSLRAAYQSSADSFAIILASVLIPLAIGARLVPRVRRSGLTPGTLLAASAVAILLATPLVERMDIWAMMLPDLVPGPAGYPVQQGQRLLLALVILGPPILLLGIVLPWLLDEFAEPERAGTLYAANTAGAVCGSLLAAWSLLPAIGFARSAWLLGAVTLLAALVSGTTRARLTSGLAFAVALVVAVAFASSVGRDRVQFTYGWTDYRILAHDEGPDATVSVVERAEGHRMLVIDGFGATEENQREALYMEWMGRLPMLLHPDPEKALVICFGTGQTAHAVRDEGPQALDIVELSPAVLEVAPHFESNRGVLDDARARPIVMDGRAWLRRTEERYDVITLEPMPPHFAGVNALYSREFYEIAASRLRPGGVAAQWLPLHLLPPWYAASVARTFQSVFPDAVLWVDPFGTGVLLGRTGGDATALGTAWPGLARSGPERGLSDDQVREGIRLGPRGLARFGEAGEVITDDNQLLAYGRIRPQKRLYGGASRVSRRNLQTITIISRSFGVQ